MAPSVDTSSVRGKERASPAPSESDSAYSSRHSGEIERHSPPLFNEEDERVNTAAKERTTGSKPVGLNSTIGPIAEANKHQQPSVTQHSLSASSQPFTFSLQNQSGPYQVANPPTPAPTPPAQGFAVPASYLQQAFASPFGLMDNWKPFGGEVGQLAEANSVVASGKAQLDEAHNFTSKGLQIRVLGVPQQNAKSRVETQIKICLQLVTDKGDKVPLWSHLRLPEHLVPREKLRKSKLKGDESLSEQSVLSLEAVVVCASDVRKTVSTCSGCIQRERKRTRKKEANSKKALQREQSNLPEPRLGPGGEEVLDDEVLALEQKKVLLFNCPHMVDFSSGDTILPTRITCYCRHHGEKLGFWYAKLCQG